MIENACSIDCNEEKYLQRFSAYFIIESVRALALHKKLSNLATSVLHIPYNGFLYQK